MCKVTRIRLQTKSHLMGEVCLVNENFRYDGHKLEIQNLTMEQVASLTSRFYATRIIKERVHTTKSEGDGIHFTYVLQMCHDIEIKIECYEDNC